MTAVIKMLDAGRFDESCRLLKAAGKQLAADGILQWDEIYPAADDVAGDIASETAFGSFNGGRLSAYMVLNQFNEPQYSEVRFNCDAEDALVLHRLAVHPDFQRRGLASAMVDFAENYAVEKGYNSLRLDAFSLNPAALSLYENRGYIRRGSVEFRKGTFYLYEKVLQ